MMVYDDIKERQLCFANNVFDCCVFVLFLIILYFIGLILKIHFKVFVLKKGTHQLCKCM